MPRETTIAWAGAGVALLLQVIIAPNIQVGHAVPSFLSVYAVVVSMLLPGAGAYVMAFALGMFGDLLGTGPVGALSAVLLVAALGGGLARSFFTSDTLPAALGALAILLLFVEVAYAAVMLACGMAEGVLDALALRAVPCAAYDAVLGLAVYPAMNVLLVSRQATMGSPAPTPRIR